jgi:hypothetical protein
LAEVDLLDHRKAQEEVTVAILHLVLLRQLAEEVAEVVIQQRLD